MTKLVFIVLLLFVHADPALAEVYKWVDDSGKVHFSDAPFDSKSAEKVDIEINSYEHPSNEDTSSDLDKKHVTMYATSWCGYCKKARNYFKANDINYTEYDIEKSRRAKTQYDALGGRGVPVILIGDKRMNGFNAAGFERIYQAIAQ